MPQRWALVWSWNSANTRLVSTDSSPGMLPTSLLAWKVLRRAKIGDMPAIVTRLCLVRKNPAGSRFHCGTAQVHVRSRQPERQPRPRDVALDSPGRPTRPLPQCSAPGGDSVYFCGPCARTELSCSSSCSAEAGSSLSGRWCKEACEGCAARQSPPLVSATSFGTHIPRITRCGIPGPAPARSGAPAICWSLPAAVRRGSG